MSSIVSDPSDISAAGANWESSRREKLERIAQLGIDPWGSRFDDQAAIASIRARATEIMLKTEDGREVALPDLTTAGADFDFRKWLSEQGPSEMHGPQV